MRALNLHITVYRKRHMHLTTDINLLRLRKLGAEPAAA
jgi:hypothetical protein